MFRHGTETSDSIKKKIRIFAILVIFSFVFSSYLMRCTSYTYIQTISYKMFESILF